MGMPLTCYTLLNDLCNKNGFSQLRIVKKAFEPFNLFAFILHIPEIHKEFDEYINKEFDMLDHLTGEKLLYFSLCNPPKSWVRYASDREYFRQFKSYELEHFINPENQIKSEDKYSAALALANSLGISLDQMPCIVVTKDFNSAEFAVLETNKNILREQFTELGLAARSVERDNLRLEKILSRTRNYSETTNVLEVTLAKALSEALSFIVINNSDNQVESVSAKKQAKQVLLKLLLELQQIKKFQNQLSINKTVLVELSMKICLLLSNVKSNRPLDHIPFDKNNFDNESYSMLKTAYRVSNLLTAERNNNEIIKNVPDEILDYIPGIVCFSKVFEKEINLSIVQWIRKYLGIDLPEYFNRLQPGKTAEYTPNIERGWPINFNSGRNFLSYPGIGQSEHVFNDLYQFLLNEINWNERNCNELRNFWSRIRAIRNNSCHVNLMSDIDLRNIKTCMIGLEERNVFRKLNELRNILSGRVT